MAKPKLAIFNVNGTFTPQYEPYDYLHRMLETMDESLMYSMQFQRRPDQKDRWHETEALLWEGKPLKEVLRALAELPWLPGAKQIVKLLKDAGVKLVLISNGFDLQLDPIAAQVGADFWYANGLCVENNKLTGEVEFRYRESERAALVEQVMKQTGVTTDECIAFGASASDIPVFKMVGWSVAVSPLEESIGAAASMMLKDPDLTPLIPLLTERLKG